MKELHVQNLDVQKLDKAEAPETPRRTFRRRLREFRIKGFGVLVNFHQKDEEGSEEK